MNIRIIQLMIISLLIILLAGCEDEPDTPDASTVADFSYTVSNNAIVPATVTFTNQSINTTYYEWDFGNGETSNAENPTVTYNEAGTYEVVLTVEAEDNLYYNVLSKTANIKIKSNPLKTLYYLDKFDNKVHFVVLDDADPVVQDMSGIATTSANFVAIDTTNAFMYISDKGSGNIIKAALDGSSVENIVQMSSTSEGGSPWGIVVAQNKLYFNIENSDGQGKIMACNLDGSNLEVAVDISDYLPLGLTYNPNDQMLYFANDGYYDDGGIWKVNLDGTGLQVVVQNQNGSPVDAAGIAIDHVNGRIYYGHFGDKSIVMNTLDGSNPVVVGSYTESKLLYGLAVDIDNGYIYWSDRPDSDGSGNGNIFRAAYTADNGNVIVQTQQKWIDGANVDLAPYGIAIDTYR